MTAVRSKRGTTTRRGREKAKSAAKLYIVSDGEMVLHLEPDGNGGYTVTSPFDPALITEADTLEGAFDMARDAAELLREGREQLLQEAREAVKARRATT